MFFYRNYGASAAHLLVPKSRFLSKSWHFQGKTNRNERQRCKANGRPNKTEKKTSKLWSLCRPPPRPEKLFFEQKLTFPRKHKQKTTKTFCKTNGKTSKTKKNVFKTMEPLPPPPPRPDKHFWAKIIISKAKPTQTNKNDVNPMKTQTKPGKPSFSKLWSLCHSPLFAPKSFFLF